jgi:hypothetical protein
MTVPVGSSGSGEKGPRGLLGSWDVAVGLLGHERDGQQQG